MTVFKYGHPKYWVKRGAGEAAQETPGFLGFVIGGTVLFLLLVVLVVWCLAGLVTWLLSAARATGTGSPRPEFLIPRRTSDARFVTTLIVAIAVIGGFVAWAATRPRTSGAAPVDGSAVAVARGPAWLAGVASMDAALIKPDLGRTLHEVSATCAFQKATGGDYAEIDYQCSTAVVDSKTHRTRTFVNGVACNPPIPKAHVRADSQNCSTAADLGDQLVRWQVAGGSQP